jgi:hypothetical protein
MRLATPPCSSAKANERAELYLYSSFEAFGLYGVPPYPLMSLLVILSLCILAAFDVVYHTWGVASDMSDRGVTSDMSDRGVTSDMSDISSASDKDEDLDELVCCFIK